MLLSIADGPEAVLHLLSTDQGSNSGEASLAASPLLVKLADTIWRDVRTLYKHYKRLLKVVLRDIGVKHYNV